MLNLANFVMIAQLRSDGRANPLRTTLRVKFFVFAICRIVVRIDSLKIGSFTEKYDSNGIRRRVHHPPPFAQGGSDE